jgi:small subunit ribosomal protein S7
MGKPESIKASECNKRRLAKKYSSIEQLQKDNHNEDVFFDKELDKTPYSILLKYKEDQKTMLADKLEGRAKAYIAEGKQEGKHEGEALALKKLLAKRIVYKAFEFIEFRTNQNPLLILEKAIRNSSPRVQLKAKRIGGATYQVPTNVRPDRSIALAIRWTVTAARKRPGKTMDEKLAAEFVEAFSGKGAAVKKREDTHKMAESNMAFAHYAFVGTKKSGART